MQNSMDSQSDKRFKPETERRILFQILRAGKNGISASDCAKKTSLSLDTISNVAKKLEHHSLIKRKKHGRWVTYFIRYPALNDVYLFSMLLGSKIFEKCIRFKVTGSSQRVDFLNNTTSPFNHSPYIEAKFTRKDWIERLLVEHSFRLGAVITFLSFLAMDTKNGPLQSLDSGVSQAEKDIIVKQWFEEVVTPTNLLWAFRQSIPYQPDSTDNSIHQAKYSLNEIAIAQLTRAFSRALPSVYAELETIQKDHVATVRDMKTEIRERQCRHDFNVPDFRNSRKRETCKICGYERITDLQRKLGIRPS